MHCTLFFRLLDWVDREKKTSKLDRIVVIKNMFDPNDFEVRKQLIRHFREGRFTLDNFCLKLSHATCLQLDLYCVNQAHNAPKLP